MSRSRSWEDPEQYAPIYVDYLDGQGTSGEQGSYLVKSKSRFCNDVVTPDFIKRINSGEVINNPCLMKGSSHTGSTGGYGWYKENSSGSRYTITGPLTQMRWDTDKPYAQTYGAVDIGCNPDEPGAKLRALANIDKTPFAFGEDILEIKETLRFIRRPFGFANQMSRDLERYKRRRRTFRDKIKLGGRTATNVADAYLAYRFALSPLVRSAHDVARVFLEKRAVPPLRLSAHGGWEGSKQDSVTPTVGSRTYKFTASREQSGHATILYEVTNPVYDWKHTLGLRLKDLPTTLWQVATLSFMVDRVLDISSFSKALLNLADPKIRILAASYTERSAEVFTYQHTKQVVSGWTSLISGEIVTSENFRYDRRIWNPTVRDAIPELTPRKLIDDTLKIADLLALSINRLR